VSKINSEMVAGLALAETVIQLGPNEVDTPLSDIAQSIASDEINRLSAAPPDVSIKETQRLTGLGQTKTRELIAAGVLEAFNDGTRIKVTRRSIARRRIALAILSHPADGPRLRIRQPKERFQKAVRPRTEAELEGLRKGNAARAREAEQRREANKVARV
jgi:hypothetical protein